MKSQVKLTIIITTHNNSELIPQLFSSLKQAINYFGHKTEVIVVDNASYDQTINNIKKLAIPINLIVNKENLGYSRANNIGLKVARGEYILLLNSDTVLEKEVLKKMVDYLESNKQVGLVTCKVVLQNGEIDPACHRGFPTPWASTTYFLGLEKLFPNIPIFSGYHLWFKPLNTIHEIDSPAGAFYLTRRKVIEEVGILSEDFFMYGEDLDWSYRIKKKGWKIMFNPQSQILHLKKQSGLESIDKQTKQKITSAFYDSMKIFYNKHYSKKYSSIVKFLIFTIIDLKKIIKLIQISLI